MLYAAGTACQMHVILQVTRGQGFTKSGPDLFHLGLYGTQGLDGAVRLRAARALEPIGPVGVSHFTDTGFQPNIPGCAEGARNQSLPSFPSTGACWQGPARLESAIRGRSVTLQALASAGKRAIPEAIRVFWLDFANRGRSVASQH